MSESVKIIVLVEGETEKAFRDPLLAFLKLQLVGRMPKIGFHTYSGRIPKEGELARVVENYLDKYDFVVALTDVYTGTSDFNDAADAKAKMRAWVGNEERFIPHVALHDFEAWLLPYWSQIQKRANTNRGPFAVHPETVNHGNPPAHRLKSLFQAKRQSYNKPREAKDILKNQSLKVAADACPELKAFLNTLLHLSGADTLP